LKVKTFVIILGLVEGSVSLGSARPWARCMTRCECAELPFEEVARRVREGRSLDEVQAETGCGRLCSACIPDLHDHLAARR
jgi:bacterioferritin-associated ferredoxin